MSSEKVEDLVKKALKEAMDKRKVAALAVTPATETMETILEAMCPKVSLDFSKSILGVGQLRLSDVINDKSLVEDEDFGVTVFNDYEWDKTISSFIPTVDNNYVLDREHAMKKSCVLDLLGPVNLVLSNNFVPVPNAHLSA
jgi:hypothetical protein